MLRPFALGAVAGLLIAWNWLRIEHGSGDGEALVIVVLALVPAAVRDLRYRTVASVVAFLAAAGMAFDVGPGLHFPGRVLSHFGQGFLDFYDVKLPFDAAAQPRMHGTVLLAVFVFTLAAALAAAARRARAASLALLVGAGWPATLLPGDDFLRGAAILAGLLVLLVGIRERPRALGWAPLAGLAVVVVALAASSSPALARHGFVNWQSWDFYTRPAKPVSVSYVWSSDYSGLHFPRKKTVVLKIKAPARPQYWRAVTLDDVVHGRWFEDATQQPQTNGDLGEPGLVPLRAEQRSSLVEQEVHVEALKDVHLVAASVPVQVDAPKLGLVTYDPSGMVFVQRGLQRGDSYTAWSFEPEPSPQQLARSKPRYPQLIRTQYKYLAVEQKVFMPPFDASDRRAVIDWYFTRSNYARQIDPYRALYDRAEEIAGDAKSPYAAAVALESWFRRGDFVYDPNPPKPPARVPPLVDFVMRTKAGYCQHFAGAMALMLRYLGIPARVAAGFSSGQYDKGNGEWIVTDHDAHEWVEAWFDGWGWVPFDPTPSRGGLAGAYSVSSRSFDATEAALVLASKDGLKSFAAHRGELGFAAARKPIHLGPDTPDLSLGKVATTTQHHSRTPGFLRLIFYIAAGLVLAIALAKLILRRSRYLTNDPRRLAGACRKELRDVLLDQFVDVSPSATLTELTALAEAELGVSAAALGAHGTAARFAPPGYSREGARELRHGMRQLRRDLRRELTLLERTRGLLSLRSLGLA